MPEFLTSCCNAPFGVGGTGFSSWYLCTACGQPTHDQDEDSEMSEAEIAALLP